MKPFNIFAVFAASLSLLSSSSFAEGFTPKDFNQGVTAIGPQKAESNVAKLRGLMPKIIGGTDASPGEFPHQVSLMFAAAEGDTTPGLDRHFCGGSIIGDEWVMTAAHCVVGMIGGLKYYSVGAGNIDLNKLEEYQIDSAWVHPMYDGESFDYDFAILKVRTPFFDPAITVVDKDDNQYVAVGNPATITGWGVDETGTIQQILKKAQVKVVSRNDCNDQNSYDGAITARMVCLGLAERAGRTPARATAVGPLSQRARPDATC